MRKFLLALSILLFAALPVRAQFYLAGDDPGYLKWYSIQTPHYKVIYPKGADSLARVYATQLEQFRPAVGRSLKLTPGEKRRRPMPVVLHTQNTYSNGSMGWAPSRMDLYTFTPPFESDPTPWSIQLASHEPRHQSQMEFADRGVMKYLTGEGWAPIHWQLFIEQSIAEGDAVVAETGIASGTRARTDAFLNYYRMSLDQGEYRSWDRWRYGSYKHETPDLYTLGYISVAGARVLYDDPFIVREAMDQSWKKPWMVAPANFQSQVRRLSGKSFKASFRDILDLFKDTWQAQDALRGPFLEQEQLIPTPNYPTSYDSFIWWEGQIYCLESGNLQPTRLVTREDGKWKFLRSFSSRAGYLYPDESTGRIYWHEPIRDPRWSLGGKSIVRYYDIETGKTKDLTHKGSYFNPQPSLDGSRVAVSEYRHDGEQAVVILDTESGQVLRRFKAPSGVQPTEMAWMDEELYVSCVEEGGYSLRRIEDDGSWQTVLPASVQQAYCFGSEKGFIEFVSDRTGVSELYRYHRDGTLEQITTLRYGGFDFWEHEDGYLYYFAPTLNGYLPFRTPSDSLKAKTVQWDDVVPHPIEDALTAQERALGPAPDLTADVPISEPRRYSKLTHPLRLHTWLPLYADYDAIMSGSMDFSYETASLGLSGYFQNTLGTFSGMVGYGAHPDPDIDGGPWRHSLHTRLLYTGLYPVFEAALDFNDQAATQTVVQRASDGNIARWGLKSFLRDVPSFSGSVRTYIPLSWSKGGVLWGLTPQLRYSFSNSYFADDPVQYEYHSAFEGVQPVYNLVGLGSLTSSWSQRLSGSLRGYVMLPRASSQVYPRWGIGAEMGMSGRPAPGLGQYYAPNFYTYVYGYVPGITRAQGLRLTTMVQTRVGQSLFGEMAANTLPRGFSSGIGSIGRLYGKQWKMTADYAIPIYVGDLSIPWVAYITHFNVTPHADMGTYWNAGDTPFKNILWSAGVDVSASLARLLFLPFDSAIGVSFSYLGGSAYKATGQSKPWSVELIFGVDF